MASQKDVEQTKSDIRRLVELHNMRKYSLDDYYNETKKTEKIDAENARITQRMMKRAIRLGENFYGEYMANFWCCSFEDFVE